MTRENHVSRFTFHAKILTQRGQHFLRVEAEKAHLVTPDLVDADMVVSGVDKFPLLWAGLCPGAAAGVPPSRFPDLFGVGVAQLLCLPT
ncbi:MAG: hypothetical protein IT327_12745 [Anaerolineae bacterium]|nr:hypothetical protein [Anaerolineae bacterium]